jgi:hypothetical protein
VAYRRYIDADGMHGQTTASNRRSVITENGGGGGMVCISIASEREARGGVLERHDAWDGGEEGGVAEGGGARDLAFLADFRFRVIKVES